MRGERRGLRHPTGVLGLDDDTVHPGRRSQVLLAGGEACELCDDICSDGSFRLR